MPTKNPLSDSLTICLRVWYPSRSKDVNTSVTAFLQLYKRFKIQYGVQISGRKEIFTVLASQLCPTIARRLTIEADTVHNIQADICFSKEALYKFSENCFLSFLY